MVQSANIDAKFLYEAVKGGKARNFTCRSYWTTRSLYI